jgi:CLASP N terminal
MERALEEGGKVCRESETENNWGEMDSVLSRLCGMLETREDGLRAAGMVDLAMAAVQSIRSRLSRSGSDFLGRLAEVLGEEFEPYVKGVVPLLVAASGKANKVVSLRAEEALKKVAESCSIDKVLRFMRDGLSGPSKQIRKSISMAVAISLERRRARVDLSEYASIVRAGVADKTGEVRSNFRRALKEIEAMNRTVFGEIVSSFDEKTRRTVLASQELSSVEGSMPPTKTVLPGGMGTARSSGVSRVVKDRGNGVGIVLRVPTRAAKPMTGMGTSHIAHAGEERSYPSIYMLNRIGKMLSSYQKEAESGRGGEGTPKKNERSKKRERVPIGTPLNVAKKEKENSNMRGSPPPGQIGGKEAMENVSLELQNLSLTLDNGEEQEEAESSLIVGPDLQDDVFFGRSSSLLQRDGEIVGSAEFVQSTCKLVSNEEASAEGSMQEKTIPNSPSSENAMFSAELSGVKALQELSRRSLGAIDLSDSEYTEINSRIMANKKTTRKV